MPAVAKIRQYAHGALRGPPLSSWWWQRYPWPLLPVAIGGFILSSCCSNQGAPKKVTCALRTLKSAAQPRSTAEHGCSLSPGLLDGGYPVYCVSGVGLCTGNRHVTEKARIPPAIELTDNWRSLMARFMCLLGEARVPRYLSKPESRCC